MISILAAQTTNSTASVQDSVIANDIIGIGGIIATIVVGLLTCFVTYKLTMKSIKQKKLSYNMQIYQILSNSITRNSEVNLEDFQIKYKDSTMQNPCLLAIEIYNMGNDAIIEPPIKISANESVEIVPGYFEDIPSGYEDLWSMSKLDKSSCKLQLMHVNPKQVVKARFFLDNQPEKKIKFECPMPNVQIQEINYSNTKEQKNNVNIYALSNYFLLGITALLLVTVQQWSYYIERFIWVTGIHLQKDCVAIYILSILFLTIIINVNGIKPIDVYIKTHPKRTGHIKLCISVVSIIFLVLIIFDIVNNFVLQTIIAVIVAFLLAIGIHITMITKSYY